MGHVITTRLEELAQRVEVRRGLFSFRAEQVSRSVGGGMRSRRSTTMVVQCTGKGGQSDQKHDGGTDEASQRDARDLPMERRKRPLTPRARARTPVCLRPSRDLQRLCLSCERLACRARARANSSVSASLCLDRPRRARASHGPPNCDSDLVVVRRDRPYIYGYATRALSNANGSPSGRVGDASLFRERPPLALLP